jgi:hypothetical protein
VRRSDKWWHREIEKIRRDAANREAELIATICHLAGKPLPADTEPEPEPVEDEIALVIPDYYDD